MSNGARARKERKGKERKGEEKKGREREGKDRKRKGRERKGKERNHGNKWEWKGEESHPVKELTRFFLVGQSLSINNTCVQRYLDRKR